MSSQRNDLFRELRLLSMRVAKMNDDLHESACLSPEVREFIGFLNGYKEAFKDNSFEMFKTFFLIYGRFMWKRTELSDLGFMLGERGKTEKDVSHLREVIDKLQGEDF